MINAGNIKIIMVELQGLQKEVHLHRQGKRWVATGFVRGREITAVGKTVPSAAIKWKIAAMEVGAGDDKIDE